MKMKIRLPLAVVKPACIVASLIGLFGVVSGSWVVGLCMLMGAWLFETNLYRCPHCRKRLNMKGPLPRDGRCPACGDGLK